MRAGLLPADKVAEVEALAARHATVAMIGDGVNDAPAMARASFGIAMGAIGSDAAIETADVALMSDEIERLPWLVRHARRTLSVIRWNIAFSLGLKALFVLLTALGVATLWGAIAADVGATLLVVANALRLLRGRADDGADAVPFAGVPRGPRGRGGGAMSVAPATDTPTRTVAAARRPAFALLFAAWLVALGATLGALFIGEVLGQTPCTLCWYQRIAMFPLALLLGLACLHEDASVGRYALPLAAAGRRRRGVAHARPLRRRTDVDRAVRRGRAVLQRCGHDDPRGRAAARCCCVPSPRHRPAPSCPRARRSCASVRRSSDRSPRPSPSSSSSTRRARRAGPSTP